VFFIKLAIVPLFCWRATRAVLLARNACCFVGAQRALFYWRATRAVLWRATRAVLLARNARCSMARNARCSIGAQRALFCLRACFSKPVEGR